MTAISLFDVMAEARPSASSTSGVTVEPRVMHLLEMLVASTLDDLDRIREYEKQIEPPSRQNPEIGFALLQAIWQLYKQWVDEAQQVYTRANAFRGTGAPPQRMDQLDDAIGRVLARLSVTPEQIYKATEQVRQGQFIPARELRDELHARLRP